MNALSIYKSSAGSGKTYTLVREYLKLVLPFPTNFRHVLAVTFTNKATDEMKGRILKTLIELAEGKNKNLQTELNAEPALSKLDIQQQAQQCLNFILHHYSDFAVTTIDSFFNSIVKSLAHEMKLPLRFEIELDQEYINESITGRLLQEIGKDDKLTKWLQAFAFDKMENNSGWKIKPDLLKVGQQLFKEEFYSYQQDTEPDYIAITEQLKSAKKKFELQTRSYGEQFNTHLTKHGFFITDFQHGDKGIAGFLTKLSRPHLAAKDFIPGIRTQAAYADPNGWLSKTKPNEVLAQFISSTLHPLLKNYMQFYGDHFVHYTSATEALKLIYVSGIITQLSKHLRDYRDEHDLITIADANLLIKKFVTASDTPFVYEKTGNKFRHFLLDEFQDTSDIQWKNLLPLINNSLASGNSTLIVGDVKQAIYRWRGGNMNLLQNGVKDDLKVYESLIKEKNLNTNYRSTKEVIEFNNNFFSLLPNVVAQLENADYNLIAAAYHLDEVKQELPEKNKLNGYVNIAFIDKQEIINDDENEGTSWKQESLNRLIPTIDRVLNDGYNWSDIAILVRTRYEGNEIARYLFKNGITKIISADSLLLHKAIQVQFIVNAMRYLYDKSNILVKKEMLYFIAISNNKTIDLEHIFNDEADILFTEWMPPSYLAVGKIFLQLPVYDLSEQLMQIFDLNKSADAYLQRLQDVILEYTEKNPQDSISFINWWDDHAERKGFSVIMPEQSDAITIITIHKSKGLQYPVVLMPMCDWKLKPKANELLWVTSNQTPYNLIGNLPVKFNKKLSHTFFNDDYIREMQHSYLDNLNLLYVAFTRAAERLYITTQFSKTESLSQISQLILLIIKYNQLWNSNYNETENIFELGVEVKKETSVLKDTKVDFFSPLSIRLNSFMYNPWQEKINIRTNKEYLSADMEFGNILHKTLSFIITQQDLETALNKVSNVFITAVELSDKIKNAVNQIFEISLKYEWFSGKYFVRNESEIVYSQSMSPPNSTIYRPDRLMFNDMETIILDYKTGAENKSYHTQLNHYKTALQSAGFKNVTAYLLYTEECRIVMVKD